MPEYKGKEGRVGGEEQGVPQPGLSANKNQFHKYKYRGKYNIRGPNEYKCTNKSNHLLLAQGRRRIEPCFTWTNTELYN